MIFCNTLVINGIDQTTIRDEDENGLERERDGPGTTVGQQIEEIIRGYYYQPGHWIEEFFTTAGEVWTDCLVLSLIYISLSRSGASNLIYSTNGYGLVPMSNRVTLVIFCCDIPNFEIKS